MQKIKIWDLPVRVFHWTLAAALAFMWFSAKTGGSWMAWHLRVGLLVAALLVFRLCWGIWGSDTARFARFFRPLQIGSYLRGTWDKQAQPGHNPLGALMVAALLAAVSASTGLALPVGDLEAAASINRAEIDAEAAGQPEVAAVVSALEAQYDAVAPVSSTELAHLVDVPSADEIGARLEAFLEAAEADDAWRLDNRQEE